MARKYSTQLGEVQLICFVQSFEKKFFVRKYSSSNYFTFFQSRNFENVPNTKVELAPNYEEKEISKFKGWNWKSMHVGAAGHSEFFFTTILWNIFILPIFPLYKLDKYLSSYLPRKYWCCENQPWKQDFSLPFCPFICNKNF